MKHGTAAFTESAFTEARSGAEREVAPAPRAASAEPKPDPRSEEHGFVEILSSLLGKPVTIVNPESYEEAPVGHRIRAGFYRAKPIGLGRDYLVVATEFVHANRGQQEKEPVRQYIPFARIKRVSVMKSERLIHL